MSGDDAEDPVESPMSPEEIDATNRPAESLRFPVVGVGASAGGLAAFTKLLRNLPARPGMALVLVQHLDPNRESMLPGLLASSTTMPVRAAEDGTVLEPDHVYVIPPNAIVTVAGSRLKLTPRSEVPRPFMPVDYLFRSLPNTMGRRAIGVILSGGGTDGALGLKEITEADGITFAQDESSAAQDSMPRSAILSGSVDYVLPPEAIARELARIGRHPYLADHAQRGVGEPITQEEEFAIQRVFGLMRTSSGVDFSRYKRNTLLRRTRRRMGLRRLEQIGDYVKLLEREPEEVGALYQDYLIRVTSFFRDPAAFDRLRDQTFPALLRDRSPDQPIRIWVVGCATGEEVYSVAITLVEALGERAYGTQVKIMATDVNGRTRITRSSPGRTRRSSPSSTSR